MSQYEDTRNLKNPFRGSRAPFVSEMIQWNDGYDKGYFQATTEANTKYADYETHKQQNLGRMTRISDLESELRTKEAELMRQIWALRNEVEKLTARLSNSQDMTDPQNPASAKA